MIKKLSSSQVRAFRKKIYSHFKEHGRDFPWRKTRDPYHVFVSEIMLQQTQTSRVSQKFPEFIAAFPDFRSLAAAPLKEVYRQWQGMGYNRRALYLQKAAQKVVAEHGGTLPKTVEALEDLPGIGPATARSIAAYAFNLPVIFVETNIRTIFIHEFFPGKDTVSDENLLPLVEQTLDRTDPWTWYNALMDYGVMIKENHVNPGRRSRHYVRQKPFESSDRCIRGEILRRAAASDTGVTVAMVATAGFPVERVERCCAALAAEGLLERSRKRYRIPS